MEYTRRWLTVNTWSSYISPRTQAAFIISLFVCVRLNSHRFDEVVVWNKKIQDILFSASRDGDNAKSASGLSSADNIIYHNKQNVCLWWYYVICTRHRKFRLVRAYLMRTRWWKEIIKTVLMRIRVRLRI